MKKITLLIALIFSCGQVLVWAGDKTPTLKSEPAPVKEVIQGPSAPTAFELTWSSLNGGGDVTMSSTTYYAKTTTGQSVIGVSQSTNYQMSTGFWYGEGIYCLAKPGDANGTLPIGLPDVIHLVNYVFDKDRPAISCLGSSPGNCWTPEPLCRGEVNGTSPIGLPDVIHLVNYVFDKDRPATSCLGSSPGNCWTPAATGVCCL